MRMNKNFKMDTFHHISLAIAGHLAHTVVWMDMGVRRDWGGKLRYVLAAVLSPSIQYLFKLNNARTSPWTTMKVQSKGVRNVDG